MKLKFLFYTIIFSSIINSSIAQTNNTDEHKIQEVIAMVADPVALPPNADGSVPVDTMPPKGMDAGELQKRGINFVKQETKKYAKSNGVSAGSKAECTVTFPYKPKELNPVADVQGSFTMHVCIEAKEGKYRYIISKINHVAKNSEFTGGDIYNEVPKCGSMKLPSELWKRIKSEAMKQAAVVAADIKDIMSISSTIPVNTDEW
jgi:hypothetical protein